jgi:hypothetical protein
VNHLRTTIITIVAALVAALVGRWLFGGPSVPAALFIGACAAAITIIVVELLDRAPSDGAAPATVAPPSAPAAEPQWWESSDPTATATLATTATTAPVIVPAAVTPPATRTGPVDVERWRAAAGTARLFQCPRCGGFAVVRTGGDECGCQECAARWTWRKGTPWPRVVIDVRTRARRAASQSGAPSPPSTPRG